MFRSLFTSLTKEGWIGLLTAFVAFLGLILGQILPPEIQELAPYILGAIEAIGMILILVLSRATAKAIARLQGR
jgi:hypothetical protein